MDLERIQLLLRDAQVAAAAGHYLKAEFYTKKAFILLTEGNDLRRGYR